MARAEEIAVQLLAMPAQTRKIIAPRMEPEKEKKLFDMTERSLRIKTKGKYPAQTRALAVIKTGLHEGLEKGLAEEAKAFGELSVSEVSRNLVFLMFTSEFAKQMAASYANRYPELANAKIAIVGGGLMGLSMSRLASQHGFKCDAASRF